MQIKVIASGSSGNAYYISDGYSSLLLDAGVSIKRIAQGCNFKISALQGCLITHAHGDHVKSAQAIAGLGVNVYTSQGTIDAAGLTGHRIHAIKSLKGFRTGGFHIIPFDVEHDAPESLGFLITSEATKERLLYFTDTMYLKYSFPRCTHIMMETNYSPEAIENNVIQGRIDPNRAKRVINSHMSIETALKTLTLMDRSRLKQVYLLHLSNDNGRADEFKRRAQEIAGCEVYVC
ncbi:MAG: MBL fold metallo-hydrolase [Eubacteriales bacterium]|nr:MBL fold metallo-hydrolase [Eubacteriales bacterium]